MSYFDFNVGRDAMSSTLSFLNYALERGIMPLEKQRHQRTVDTGRPSVDYREVLPAEDRKIRELFDQGLTQTEIAREVGRHKSTIHYWLKKRGLRR